MHRPYAKKQAHNDRDDTAAQDAWGTHVAEVVNSTLMPGANSWYMGANIAGKARRFLPISAPKASAGIAGSAPRSPRRVTRAFVFARQGQGVTVHPIAAE